MNAWIRVALIFLAILLMIAALRTIPREIRPRWPYFKPTFSRMPPQEEILHGLGGLLLLAAVVLSLLGRH